MIKLNDEVVLGSMVGGNFYPMQHNSKNSPNHPCRGTVTKITKSFTFITSSGADFKIRHIPLEGKRHDVILPIPEARKLYRNSLSGSHRSVEFVGRCVADL